MLEGRMGARLGDEVVYAEKGDLVFKPRAQWHTFWNAGDEPCWILEIISPGGFEHLFKEMREDAEAVAGEAAAALDAGTIWRSITMAWSAFAKSTNSSFPLRNEVAH